MVSKIHSVGGSFNQDLSWPNGGCDPSGGQSESLCLGFESSGVAQGVMTSGGHSLSWCPEECLVITAADISAQL